MARGPERTDSVYDFLYVDARRIGVLLSQLGEGEDGVLTEQLRQATTSSQSGGGLNVQIAKVDHQESGSVGLTRKFDPQWLQPLLFLDLARESIVRDITKATLGQIVLARGSLYFNDYKMLMALLSQPALKRRLGKSDKINWSSAVNLLGLTDLDTKGMTPAKKQKARDDTVDLLLNVISSMPRRSQMLVQGDHGATWSVLREDSMIVSCDELAVTHGSAVPGEWIIVGLLDSRDDSPVEVVAAPSVIERLAGDLNDEVPEKAIEPAQAFINQTLSMSKAVKSTFGRPDGTFAVTPLMVFREILLN